MQLASISGAEDSRVVAAPDRNLRGQHCVRRGCRGALDARYVTGSGKTGGRKMAAGYCLPSLCTTMCVRHVVRLDHSGPWGDTERSVLRARSCPMLTSPCWRRFVRHRSSTTQRGVGTEQHLPSSRSPQGLKPISVFDQACSYPSPGHGAATMV